MRMTVIAIGYRGDVHPLIALAAGLQTAGHEVRVATHVDYEEHVRDVGLPFVCLPGRVAQFFGGAAGAAMRDRISNQNQFAAFAESYLYPYLTQLLDATWDACRDAEAIFGWPMTRMMSTLSEGLGVPCFVIAPYPMPYFPTRCFPFPFQTDTLIPEQIDTRIRQTWLQGRKLLGNFAQPVIDAWRKRLGLPVSTWQAELRHLRRIPHLLGFSSLVLPRPHDWPPNVQTTGFWALPAPRNYQPPPDLSNFLATGPPPVVFSFSSQVSRQPAEMTSAVLTAIEQTGVRGLLLAGWGGLRARHLPASVMQVPYVPHDWLFPQVAGVVHHGGCGSTAAALRAGVPNMAVTFGYDQPLWGQQLARLGVGPEPIPASKLTAERLSRAIHEMIANPKLRLAAKQLAPSIRAEDGVENAIAAVHTHLKRPQPCMC